MARLEVELAARDAYGRLIAFLAARWGDVAAAEDAMGDALLSALQSWPVDGLPDRPDAWLLSAANRRLIDSRRRDRTAISAFDVVARSETIRRTLNEAAKSDMIPDERLKLLFACASPEIDARVRTPLMLQAVLGLDARRIASAFLISPASMSQRLVRAKQQLRASAVSFAVPGHDELPSRLDSVLSAIYAAYGCAWDEPVNAEAGRDDLAAEAIHLARVVGRLLPNEPEALGLLALVLHSDARHPARRTFEGHYVPLADQDTRLWRSAQMEEAEQVLLEASRFGRIGRFQLEAAIQSAHAHRRQSGRTDWTSVALLYDALLEVSPTVGAFVGRAAAVAETETATRALELLDELPAHFTAGYQPYWALRAHLLKQTGQTDDAKEANARAVGLCNDPAVRDYLLKLGQD